MKPSVPADRSNRNIREIESLAHVADLIATNQIGRAADIVTQRMVACRLAEEESNWNNAQFLELVPVDSVGMIPKSYRQLARREGEADRKLRSVTSDKEWKDLPWGKGKGKKDWDFGKGKGGKNAWWKKLLQKGQGKDKGGKKK